MIIMSYVSFMSDEHLLYCISFLYTKYAEIKSQYTLKNFYSNQIDPIKLIFDMKFFGVSEEEKITEQINVQIDKTISNYMGTFHELLIGGINGYTAHKVGDGFEITDEQREKLLANIENIHNTIIAAELYNLYIKLESFLNDKSNAKAYYVQIISKDGNTLSDTENWVLRMKTDPLTDRKFLDSSKKNVSKIVKNNKNVFMISADRFYEILTGNKNAFAEICNALPFAINDFLSRNSLEPLTDNSIAFKELRSTSQENNVSLSTQLMNDTFKNYIGFPLKSVVSEAITDNPPASEPNNSPTEYTTLALFTGVGGLALGLEQAGFNQVSLIEKDKLACDTLRMNRPNWTVVEEDIGKIVEDGIKKYINLEKAIDLVSGEVPIAAFSHTADNLSPQDTRNSLFNYYIKILSQLQPKVFFLDSAKRLATHNSGKLLKEVSDALSNAGYKVTWQVLNALNFGDAQNRNRLIIVGVRNDLTPNLNIDFPNPLGQTQVLKDILSEVPASEGTSFPKALEQIFNLIEPGSSFNDLAPEVKRRYKNFQSQTMLKRLSWDQPCCTLLSNPQHLCHPDKIRPFTIREYARIQGFPDDWEFQGSTINLYSAISNSTPIGLAKAVGLEIIKCLEKV